MRCFNHQDKNAVGTCKHCGKGLCPDCLTDLGHGLACRNSHEQAVENINTLISRNSQVQRMTPKTWHILPAFCAFMGFVFACFGLFAPKGPELFTIVLGIGFISFSVILFVVNYRAFRAKSAQK
ncbi:MAG: hypothetical protein LBH14_06820 [Desulfobulbaceae bacterium]|nr:hypothetical protein [Desulfobulbaceae bacterium]